MKFSISRDALLKPLNLVAGVVERRQTLPVLSNVLLSLDGDRLSMTGTDLEVELVGRIQLPERGESGEVTVPARKLADICKSLPDSARLEFSLDDQRLQLRCGRSRFTLSTLPASDFPSIEQGTASVEFALPQAQLKRLIDRTSFSMAQQDVRYYLNGTLFEIAPKRLRAVATDGHRLALATHEAEFAGVRNEVHAILPRKGVLELQRLLQDPEAEARVQIGASLFRVVMPDFTFTSKLVDGRFPDYTKVLPKPAGKTLSASRSEMKNALSRASILSNEKFRGVRLIIESGGMQILASNQEHEEAEESIGIDYNGERVEIGFNVGYLVDVLGVLGGESVRVQFADGSSSVLMEDPASEGALYVVMPMRL